MLDRNITQLVNEQINKEFYSAYLYLAFSNYYAVKNLNGFANWYKVQAQEERDHALLFIQYLLNNSEQVVLTEIAMPANEYPDFSAPLKAGFEHECFVTASINNIYGEALAIKDFRTTQFLDWFIKEQGEEEKNADELIQKYALFGQDSKSLYLLDAELATRVYAPPSLVI